MKIEVQLLCFCMLVFSLSSKAQKQHFQQYDVTPVSVHFLKLKFNGKDAIKVVKDSSVKAFDEPTFIRIDGVNFKNVTIEVKVFSKLLPNAPELSRGFIGVAFRINETNTKFESIYIRPLNARANEQLRRNHSIQYYSYPDYKFDVLRKIAPEQYESYADMEMNKWITLRIEVIDAQAKLYINQLEQPSLVVNDLKLGSSASGAIGLWVDIGTEGYFADLRINKVN